MAHTAEIIAVGTELLLGNIANTNAQNALPEPVRLGDQRLFGTPWWGIIPGG